MSYGPEFWTGFALGAFVIAGLAAVIILSLAERVQELLDSARPEPDWEMDSEALELAGVVAPSEANWKILEPYARVYNITPEQWEQERRRKRNGSQRT